jgi:DNA-directed RNA polymerase subunit beta'
VSTTVGRALLSDICPPQIPFEAINKVMGKKQLAELIDLVYREAGQKATGAARRRAAHDRLHLRDARGISICLDDMVIPPSKESLLEAQEGSRRDRGAVHRGSHHRR